MKKQMIVDASESRMASKKRERSEIIMNAAFECFNENGFKNTTMAMIADKADLSVGSLYNYHGTKEELLLNGILSSRNGYADEISDLAKNELPCEARWIKLTDIYLASFSQYEKRVWREFMATVFSDAPERMLDIERIDMPFIDGIRDILHSYPVKNKSSAEIIYQLWLQKILRFMLSESVSAKDMQLIFLEDLRTLGLMV